MKVLINNKKTNSRRGNKTMIRKLLSNILPLQIFQLEDLLWCNLKIKALDDPWYNNQKE